MVCGSAAPFHILVFILIGTSCVYGLQSSWGYRGFKVSCDRGIRLVGHALEVLPGIGSKSQCLKRCFARLECQSISYLSRMKECHLSSSSREESEMDVTEDKNDIYCGPESGEIWERAVQTVELPTTPEPNECDSNPCQNGAACIDGFNIFTCNCTPGYEGDTCDTNIDECSSGPCQNGGACVDGVDQFSCNCVAGYDGTLCENNIDECNSSPCQNGGTCVDGADQFTCNCVAGYDGNLCENNIDECSSGPCQNGGACVDGIDQFSCNCVAGYDGTFCENNIDECSTGPCQNGGACVDGVNEFSCSCSAGYSGSLCENNIDECNSGPCQNGGACVDGVDQFSCNCVYGVSGTLCEVEPVPAIHLFNGPAPNEGRVEVWYNGQWGTVCDDGWDIADANVACRQLGYPYATDAWKEAHYGQGSNPILLDNTNCAGSETRLHDCPHGGWGVHNCAHSEDSGLKCYLSDSIRLVNGPSPNEGRVEVYYGGSWGTVCDDSWDMADANVACKQLGYPSAAQYWVSATHGQGSGPIHLDNTACTGSETSLGDCGHLGWGSHNCAHSEDSSVRCNLT